MDSTALTQLLLEYKYALMAPGALLLGPTVSLISGAMLRFEIVQLLPTALSLAAGELFGDVLWYWLGYRWGDGFVSRFGEYVGITDERVATTKRIYNEHHDAIVLVSKLTAGLGIAPVVFFTAGLSKVPFARYMAFNILGQVIWTSVMLWLGYHLGDMYLSLGTMFHRISYLSLIALAAAGIVGFAHYLQKRFIEAHKL